MLASFSISPSASARPLSKHVAEIVDLIDRSGLKYKLGAMQTTVEGDDAEVMALILQCHRHMRAKAKRVITHIAIDDREGRFGAPHGQDRGCREDAGRKLSRE